jgi:lipoate-protein ligase A
LPYVRRLTGGGAIVHDDEITYSLALPGPLVPLTNALYSRLHAAIAACLNEVGVGATVGAATDDKTARATLCFSRSDPHAVRLRGIKILGSAQRRRTESTLMHGSLMLARSPAAPGVLGIRDLQQITPSDRELRAVMARAVETALDVTLNRIELPSDIRQKAVQLAKTKYESAEWNERRAE